MANSPQLVPAGIAVLVQQRRVLRAAHIIETIRGKPFEDVIRERVFAPLGMRTSFYFPEDCMTYRVATGHIVTREGPKIARRWHMWRSGAGGGGVISNVDRPDALRRAARRRGRSRQSVLSRAASREMQRVQRRGRQHVRIDRHLVDARRCGRRASSRQTRRRHQRPAVVVRDDSVEGLCRVGADERGRRARNAPDRSPIARSACSSVSTNPNRAKHKDSRRTWRSTKVHITPRSSTCR